MDALLDYDRDFLAPPWGPLGRDLTLGIVSLCSKFVLQLLNRTVVHNHEAFNELVFNRPPGVGLLTVSNHTSTFDDPGLPCAMLPWHFFWTEHTHGKNRWTMCASDICFTNELFRQFFLNGKTLPVERGAGVAQASISIAARALGGGDWLHIFPEGRVVPDGSVGPFRQGIGRLICDARAAAGGRDPVVLPYFHSGMARVMPFKASLPRPGHTVTVAVGQPVDLAHITCRCNQPGEDQQEVWRDIAAALRDAVVRLEHRVPPNPDQVQERPDVAEWERRYEQRLRERRAEQQQEVLLQGADGGGGCGLLEGQLARARVLRQQAAAARRQQPTALRDEGGRDGLAQPPLPPVLAAASASEQLQQQWWRQKRGPSSAGEEAGAHAGGGRGGGGHAAQHGG